MATPTNNLATERMMMAQDNENIVYGGPQDLANHHRLGRPDQMIPYSTTYNIVTLVRVLYSKSYYDVSPSLTI